MRRISVHECFNAVGRGIVQRIFLLGGCWEKLPLRALTPLSPPFLPRQSPGAKGGQAGTGIRLQASGGTAKQQGGIDVD
jgi:hypothetical protein